MAAKAQQSQAEAVAELLERVKRLEDKIDQLLAAQKPAAKSTAK